jgi:superfamily II DNA or RNA helicase
LKATLNVTLGAHFIIKVKELDGLGAIVHRQIRHALEKKNPDRSMKQHLGLSVKGIPEYIKLYRYSADGSLIHIDRAAWPQLMSILDNNQIEPNFIDNRVSVELKDFPVFNGELEDYQEAAIKDIQAKSCQGLVEIATAGGKTVTALALLSRLKQRSIIFVHTIDILDQWERQAKRFLPGVDVGIWYGAKKKEGKHITIATIQSMDDALISRMSKEYGLIVMDECHRAASPSFQNVVGNMAAKFRYGLTATIKRKDGKHFLLSSTFGEVLVKLEYADITDRIILPTVYPVEISTSTDYSRVYFDKVDNRTGQLETYVDYVLLDELLAQDMERNAIVTTVIRSVMAAPETYGLVLTKRVEHAQYLAEVLRGYGISAEAAYGEMSKKARSNLFERARKKEIRCIVGTSLADEGLDIVVLNRLFLVAPTSFDGKLTQRIGRVIRVAEGKDDVAVIDFVDKDVLELASGFEKRKRFFAKHDIEVKPFETLGIRDLSSSGKAA